MYLIHQTSRKERAEDLENLSDIPETTGKYGTGFMTTYLLSRVVEVKGIYDNIDENIFQNFKFTLDRDTTIISEMLEKHKKVCDIYNRLDDFEDCKIVAKY